MVVVCCVWMGHLRMFGAAGFGMLGVPMRFGSGRFCMSGGTYEILERSALYVWRAYEILEPAVLYVWGYL